MFGLLHPLTMILNFYDLRYLICVLTKSLSSNAFKCTLSLMFERMFMFNAMLWVCLDQRDGIECHSRSMCRLRA